MSRIGSALIVSSFLVSLASVSACGGGGEEDGARVLESYPEVVSMGALYPYRESEEDVADNRRVPFERVILLRATGDLPVNISKVCLVGDGANQFVLEGPKPATATAATDAAVRVTYEREGKGGPDQIALVVESDATTPTLVVPICARVVADGASRDALECEPPVTTADASCP